MSILDRDMIKQAVCELVDKAIDSQIGGAENIKVSYLRKFFLVGVVVLLCEYFKGFVSPMKIRLVDKVVEHPQEGKVGDMQLLLIYLIY